MDVKWGKQSKVLLRSGGFVELFAYEQDAPATALIGRQGVVSVLSREDARRLGFALIRVANSGG